jgi:hypothetical protein
MFNLTHQRFASIFCHLKTNKGELEPTKTIRTIQRTTELNFSRSQPIAKSEETNQRQIYQGRGCVRGQLDVLPRHGRLDGREML